MSCESNDNRSKTVSTVSRLYANPIFLLIKWPYGITCGFFPLFSPLLCFVSCLHLLALSFYLYFRMLPFCRFVGFRCRLSLRSPHTLSFSYTHIHSIFVPHSFIHSFTLSHWIWLLVFSFYWNVCVLIDFKFNPFGRKFIDFIQPLEWFVGFFIFKNTHLKSS